MNEIEQIARAHLRRVKKSGPVDVMAICPFHRKADGSEERQGSFSISTQTGLWYCHSCHEKGNLRKFLTNIGVTTFVIENRYRFVIEDAERNRAPAPDPLRPTPITNVDIPLEESWLGLFDHCPLALVEEGFPEDLLRRLDIGFDQKHERITFPLRDWKGTLIGISGRAIHDRQQPRYKVYDWEYADWNLPQRTTEKRKLLWNADRVMKQLRDNPEERYVVAVEGFKACMRVMQAGLNCVALLGSYLSLEQQWVFEKMGVEVYVMLDNNAAGLNGRMYACKELSKSLPVRIVEYDYDIDQPSDLTPEQICDAFFDAPTYASWYINQVSQL